MTERNNETNIKLTDEQARFLSELSAQNYIEQQRKELERENEFKQICKDFWKSIRNFFGLIIAVFFRIISKIIYIASGIFTFLIGFDWVLLKISKDSDTAIVTEFFWIAFAVFFVSGVINTITKLYIRDSNVKWIIIIHIAELSDKIVRLCIIKEA